MQSDKAADPSPHTVEDYLRRAQACERLAESAGGPEHAEVILRIARMWRILAADRAKLAMAEKLRG